MAITFPVDDVVPSRTPLPGLALDLAVREAVGVDLVALSHAAELVDRARNYHPFLQAVHLAFAGHRPLSLSPDHVWLTIAQGFAIHIDQNADAVRQRFVRHDGRAEIGVDIDAPDVPQTAEAWSPLLKQFANGIEQHVGPGVHRLFACSFSTTTEIERVASAVVMMSAFRRYFDYVLRCICGIPTITLEGTPQDWAEIRRRVEVLAEYDLGWWASSLRPILDEFTKTAHGHVDRDFWQCIYKPEEAYGGELVTGWVMRLFPYLQRGDGPTLRNPAVHQAADAGERARWISEGVRPRAVPLGFNRATVVVKTESRTTRMSVYGGLAGVRETEDGALRVEAAWAVGACPRMTMLVDRILTEHETRRRVEETDDARRPALPAELVELYERCDGAVLFGKWHIARMAELRVVVGSSADGFLGLDPQSAPTGSYCPSKSIPALPLCKLDGDPRFFGVYKGDRFVVILCDPRQAQTPEDIVVVAEDVATFFERTLESRGALWFEGIREPKLYEHLGRYHDHLRRALTVGSHPPPTNLDTREKCQLIMLLSRREGSGEQRAFWWDALRVATGTSKTFAELFERRGRRRAPVDVMSELGLR